MTNTYWNNTGTYENTLKVLHDLIDEKFNFDTVRMPRSAKGQENYHLERLRKAKNVYYRFHNDGDGGVKFYHAFGFGANEFKMWDGYYSTSIYKHIDDAMDKLIESAAAEQEITLCTTQG